MDKKKEENDRYSRKSVRAPTLTSHGWWPEATTTRHFFVLKYWIARADDASRGHNGLDPETRIYLICSMRNFTLPVAVVSGATATSA